MAYMECLGTVKPSSHHGDSFRVFGRPTGSGSSQVSRGGFELSRWRSPGRDGRGVCAIALRLLAHLLRR